jgi:hypothetical protein
MPAASEITETKRTGLKSCLTVVAVIFGLLVLIAIVAPAAKDNNGNSAKADASNLAAGSANAPPELALKADSSLGNNSERTEPTEEESAGSNLTLSQMNAARSARQYLSMTGFSRDGLIDQLSSDAGDGYSVADATAAVDSLSVDWNENAARSARQYLDMTGFSCQGLIEQLSSSAGEKYTRAQATYGARQAGAC